MSDLNFVGLRVEGSGFRVWVVSGLWQTFESLFAFVLALSASGNWQGLRF